MALDMITSRLLPLLLSIASCGSDSALLQSAPFVASAVQADVRKTSEALYSGDYQTVVDYTSPEILALMGGSDKAVVAIADTFNQLLDSGITVESLTFPEEPVFFSGEKNDFALVPTLMTIQAPQGRAESLNFQVGSRPIGTEKWRFTEGSRLTLENVRSFFPDYPIDREFPKTYRKKL